jgi:hypothetical protein
MTMNVGCRLYCLYYTTHNLWNISAVSVVAARCSSKTDEYIITLSCIVVVTGRALLLRYVILPINTACCKLGSAERLLIAQRHAQ